MHGGGQPLIVPLPSALCPSVIFIWPCLILIIVSRFYFCFFMVAAGPTMVGEGSSLGWLAGRADPDGGVGAAREWKIGLHFCTRSAELHLCSCICNFLFLARPKGGAPCPGWA